MRRALLAVAALVAGLLAGVASASATTIGALIPAHTHWDVHKYTDHEVQFCYDVQASASGAGSTIAFLPLRELDSKDFMQLTIKTSGLILRRRVSGTFTTDAPSYSTSHTYGVGSKVMIDFTMVGDTYTAYQLNPDRSRGPKLYRWVDATYSYGVSISYYTSPRYQGRWDFVHAFPINGGAGERHDIAGLEQDARDHPSLTGAATFDSPVPASGDAHDIMGSTATFGLASGSHYRYTITKNATHSTSNGSLDFRDPGRDSQEKFFQNSWYRFRTGAVGGKVSIQRYVGTTASTTYHGTAGGPGTYTINLVGPDIYVDDAHGHQLLHVNDGGPQSGLRVRVIPAPGECWDWSGSVQP